jgi:hypothetical protein
VQTEFEQPLGPSGHYAEQSSKLDQALYGIHQPPYFYGVIQNQIAEAQQITESFTNPGLSTNLSSL